MADSVPPPTYSQQDPVESVNIQAYEDQSAPQILIIPTANAVNFQKGFLGADGERAAMEGELQVKGAAPDSWGRV